jgi:hypothetical protein
LPIRLGEEILQTPKSSTTGIKISLATLHRADLAKTNLISILTQGTNLKKI